MGEGTQAGQGTHLRDQRLGSSDHKAACSGKARRRARKKRREGIPPLGEAFAENLLHFFPRFPSWLLGFSDGRCQGKTEYPKELCIWAALAIFIQGLGSRNQYNHEVQADLHSRVLLANLNALAGAFKVSIRTLKNFFIRMADSLRHCLIRPIEQMRQAASTIQIHLDTS